MDWSRCCNSLSGYADGVYQVGVFERELSKHHYYSAVLEGPARAMVCTWEETEAWLKEEAAKEKAKEEKTKSEVAEAVENRGGFGASKAHKPPEINTGTKGGVEEGGLAGKKTGAVQSPRSPNTFPGDNVRTPRIPAGLNQGQKSKTGSAALKTRKSFPHLRKLFSKKAPPLPHIQKGVDPAGH